MAFTLFLPYLIVMAGVTYLVRVIPFVSVRHKIKNSFINSFLYYIPYSVLAAMTVPAILYATGTVISAAAGLITAVLLAVRKQSLIVVALGACLVVFVVEVILGCIPL